MPNNVKAATKTVDTTSMVIYPGTYQKIETNLSKSQSVSFKSLDWGYSHLPLQAKQDLLKNKIPITIMSTKKYNSYVDKNGGITVIGKDANFCCNFTRQTAAEILFYIGIYYDSQHNNNNELSNTAIIKSIYKNEPEKYGISVSGSLEVFYGAYFSNEVLSNFPYLEKYNIFTY